MNQAQKLIAGVIVLCALTLGFLAGWLGGGFFGRADGRKLERADQDHRTVQDLTGLIDSHKALIGQANAASKAMRTAVAARATQDALTTLEFKDALSSTADSRAGCVFPAGVMRQLSTARDRAAEAAASGVRGAVPGAGGSGQP